MVDIILKYEHTELVKDVPFEARWFIYFSIEKSFGENLAMLEEYLKVWNIENPNAKTYFSKAIEKGDKTYFAITIEFDYPTYLNEKVVNRLIDETKQNFTTFFHQKLKEI